MYKYLKRETNSVAFIPEIDGLRFFAIITVVFFHLNTALSDSLNYNWRNSFGTNSPLEFGWWLVRLDLGVKVFFAISGFILSLPFLRHFILNEKKIELKSYLYRRLLRLEPPFVISLTMFFLIQLILLDLNEIEHTQHYLANLIYAHGFIYGQNSPINPVTWSLETEAQFYIFIPIFLSFIFWSKSKWLPILFLSILFISGLFLKKSIFENTYQHFITSLPVFITNFVTGIFFAFLYIKKTYFIKHKSNLFDFVGLLSIIGMFYFYKPQIVIKNNLFFNISIFIFFISVFKGTLFNWLFTRKLVYVIGGMCYSIYLLHYGLFYFLAHNINSKLPFILYDHKLFVFSIISLLLLAFCTIIFFILVEKPCMSKGWPQDLMNYLNRSK